MGYQTVQNPTRRPNPVVTPERMVAEDLNPDKNPDLLVEDRIFDTYTPRTNNLTGIWEGMEEKIVDRQTRRIAVDLRNTTHTEATIRAMLRAKPIEGLQEVVVRTREGLGQPFRPLIPARTSFDPLAPAAKGRPSRVGTRSRLVRTGMTRPLTAPEE